ncbi:MAG: hypothetical protein K5838_07495 [Elusimicrobiales bacterium]|nr:hypothetical protein [Elusimicrobiales bacterium]
MRLLKLLLLSLLALPMAAQAGEVLDPFYAPAPGHVLSKTSFTFGNNKLENGIKTESQTLNETIYYGINPSWTLFLDASNTWNDPDNSAKYEVRYWDIGLGYFFEPAENTSLDLELYYTESKPEEMDKDKNLYFYGRYDFMKDQDVKPFIGLEYARNLHQITKSHEWGRAFAGLWTKVNGFLVRADILARYVPDTPESTDIALRMETGYQFTEKFALDLYASYDIYNHAERNPVDTDKNCSAGIMAKILF